MTWNVRPPHIDVDDILRRASSRVCVGRSGRQMNVLSRRHLDRLISQAILETVQRLREEGALSLAQAEARLATESRRELDALLAKVQDLGPLAQGDVYLENGEAALEDVSGFGGAPLEAGRGLDLGSVYLRASARRADGGQVLYSVERNAFLDVRGDGFTQSTLRKFGIDCVVRGAKAYVLGNRAFELATVFDKPVRRPLKQGPGAEPEGALLARELLELVLGRARQPEEICVYSVAGEPADGGQGFLYHQGVLENALRSLGYHPRPMIESHLIIQGEFRTQDFTGIGITCGGGAFNVCVACKGLPALTFSTSRGGDWVDENVAQALGRPVAQVCATKERGMHLYRPEDPVEGAVAIYYRHLLQDLLETLKRKIGESGWMPSFPRPIDIVCAGGSAMVGGFLEMFREELRKAALPIPVGDVRLAEDPMRAVVTGCLRAAMQETRAKEEEPALVAPSVVERAAPLTTPSIPRPVRLRPAG
jgi:hypothetical protein